MRQSILWLACQIPECYLSLSVWRYGSRNTDLPKLCSVGGFSKSKLFLCDANSKRRFPDTAFADQYHLSIDVTYARRDRCSGQQGSHINPPNANHTILFAQGCEFGLRWVEGEGSKGLS